ncbi:MAG: hypothetical protein FWD71_20410 [Oscillospiraceae bacterium]|nr:hypothetical protein [Oscillospiraceae bacterium]
MDENIITKNTQNFIGYEYKDVTVKHDMENVYTEGYKNFGWKLEGDSLLLTGLSTTALKFKRERKIRNKAELSRLQRQFDSGVHEIEHLESSRTTAAIIAAFTIGIIGAACILGAVVSCLVGVIPLMVVLAVPGFIGCAVSYICYRKISAKRDEKTAPLIEEKYDELYEICVKARELSE